MGQRTRRNRIELAPDQPPDDAKAQGRAAELARLVRYHLDRQSALPEEGLGDLLGVLMTLTSVPGHAYELSVKHGRPIFRLTYGGMCGLAMRDSEIVSFAAHVVYDKDMLAADYGSGILTHAPTLGEPGAIVGCYVHATLANGARPWEFYRAALLAEEAEGETGSAEELLRRAAIRRFVPSSSLPLQPLRWALDAEAQSWAGGRIILPWIANREMETVVEAASPA